MDRKPVILVIDDDDPILLLMRNLLREFGFEPHTANTGQLGIETAKKRTPDLILLDKNMPGMTGEEVMVALRGTAELNDVPVIMLTGDPVDPNEIARVGATAGVQKPFDVPQLIEMIRAHVSART